MALHALAQEQHGVSQATAPEVMYLATLTSLITQGRAALLPNDQRLDTNLSNGVRPVGWRDEKTVCLLPEAVHEVVTASMTTSRQHSSLTVRNVYARWVERGWARPSSDDRHLGVRARRGGGQP